MDSAHETASGESPARVAPNRLSSDPASDYYDEAAVKGLRVFIDGREVRSCVEYSITGEWAKLHLLDGRGNPKRERGRHVLITKRGKIEARY